MGTRTVTRVLIATDVRLYRDSLRQVLGSSPDVEVVAGAGSAEEALQSAEDAGPDVILLDPSLAGAELLVHSLHRASIALKIVILGLARVEVEVIRWAKHGIHGFVTRDNSVDQLVATIRAVRDGKCLCSPRVASALLRELAKRADGRGYGEHAACLTRREYEVGHLLAHGISNKEIARSLGISVSTAKNHVHNILTKLGLERRAQVGGWIRRHAIPSRSRSHRPS